MFWVVRKYWPAVVVLGLSVVRMLRSKEPSNAEMLCLCLAGAGVLTNLLVVLLNGKMPVATSADGISEEDRDYYQPIDEQTRLRSLADWIDVGWAWFSPGDVLIYLGVCGLIVRVVVLSLR